MFAGVCARGRTDRGHPKRPFFLLVRRADVINPVHVVRAALVVRQWYALVVAFHEQSA